MPPFIRFLKQKSYSFGGYNHLDTMMDPNAEDSMRRKPPRLRWRHFTFFNWIYPFVLVTINAILHFVPPYQRDFDPSDPAISHPLKDSLVPESLLLVVAGVFPLLILLILCWKFHKLHLFPNALYCFSVAVMLSLCVTELFKFQAGRLRPNFLAMCAYSATEGRCTASESVVNEARRSFPSGHACFSFAAFGFYTFASYLITAAKHKEPLTCPAPPARRYSDTRDVRFHSTTDPTHHNPSASRPREPELLQHNHTLPMPPTTLLPDIAEASTQGRSEPAEGGINIAPLTVTIGAQSVGSSGAASPRISHEDSYGEGQMGVRGSLSHSDLAGGGEEGGEHTGLLLPASSTTTGTPRLDRRRAKALQGPSMGRLLLYGIPFLIAGAIAVSRTQDFHHNFDDIVAGALIGLGGAIFAHRALFRPYTVLIEDSEKAHISTYVATPLRSVEVSRV